MADAVAKHPLLSSPGCPQPPASFAHSGRPSSQLMQKLTKREGHQSVTTLQTQTW